MNLIQKRGSILLRNSTGEKRMKTIGFIGAGNMAYALAKAFVASNNEYQTAILDPSAERVAFFRREFKSLLICQNSRELIEKSDLIFLAVKPQVVPSVLKELSQATQPIVSIAAGIPLQLLKEAIPNAPLIRVMPNTPCLVGKMAAGVVFSSNTDASVQEWVLRLLSSAGTVVEVEESQMDAVTGLSGSGPAFVARLIEAFIQSGIKEGLTSQQSAELSFATFEGTVRLLKEKGMSPNDLVAMVSSPNGTTVAGRSVLESSNYKKIIGKTIEAAKKRSEELGQCD